MDDRIFTLHVTAVDLCHRAICGEMNLTSYAKKCEEFENMQWLKT